jgi:hypothetical protein
MRHRSRRLAKQVLCQLSCTPIRTNERLIIQLQPFPRRAEFRFSGHSIHRQYTSARRFRDSGQITPGSEVSYVIQMAMCSTIQA